MQNSDNFWLFDWFLCAGISSNQNFQIYIWIKNAFFCPTCKNSEDQLTRKLLVWYEANMLPLPWPMGDLANQLIKKKWEIQIVFENFIHFGVQGFCIRITGR